MIPKVIHYCWFGGNELPSLAKKCIASWKQILPEYQIKEWNESNFNLDLYPYARQAYESRKFAYVTDVVRLYALKHEGGVYLDSDVEILKPLDNFLHHAAFSGFEDNNSVPTGIMASEKNSDWVNDMLQYYEGKSFYDKGGSPILETNVIVISNLMRKKGFVMDNTFQEVPNYIAFYPSDVFCPKSHATGELHLTENSVCIHHFAGSWLPTDIKIRRKLAFFLRKIIGNKFYKKLRGYE